MIEGNATMLVHSIKFGDMDVPEETILDFPEGIAGFPGLRRACLLPHHSTAGFRWLQSLDDPALVFLTLEPHLIFPNYDLDLPEADASALDLDQPRQAAVLTLVTIADQSAAVTANLLAPIVINIHTRRAKQVILETDRYTTNHLIGSGIED